MACPLTMRNLVLTASAVATVTFAGFGCGDDAGSNTGASSRPVANAGDDQSGLVDQELVFDGSASTDDKMIVAYIWDFGDGDSGTGVTTTHAYEAPGTYLVELTVIDNDGNEDTDAAQITIGGDASGFMIVAEDTGVTEDPFTVAVMGAPPDVASYSWNFGDSPANVDGADDGSSEHIYEEHGMFTITLTATTTSGSPIVLTHDVQILARPLSQPSGPTQAMVGEEVTLSGEDSRDPDGTVVRWQWDFADNFFGDGEVVTHTFTQPGSYEVALTVTDNDDLTGVAGLKITVAAASEPPVANCGPAMRDVQVGAEATLSGSGSNDPDGMIESYEWDFGDGSDTATGEQVQHTWSALGEYTVTLTVTDDSGTSDTAECTVNVVDEPADISGTYAAGPPIMYQCAMEFGINLVNINVQQFQFMVAGNSLTIQGLPMGGFFDTNIFLSGSAPTGPDFTATATLVGGCNETYTLTGTFDSPDHWVGTFTTAYSGAQCNQPPPCMNLEFDVEGTR